MKRKEKLLSIFMVLFAMINTSAWGDSKTYYAKATVKGDIALGKVYVSSASTDNPKYSTTGESTATGNANSTGNNANVTFYLYAQPNNTEDYEFIGWSESEDGNVINNSATQGYSRTISASSTDGKNPTPKTWYAKFAQKLAYYTQLNAVGGVGGSVNITSTSDITTEAIENGMSASSITKQANAPRISYTLTATAASGYQFSGWYRDAELSNRASQNASYTVNIDAKTDVAEATQTFYAKFEQLHDYYKHVYAKAVGEGLVYLGTSNRNISNDAYNTEFDIPNHVNQVNAPANSTYYWIAKEVDGYNFKGWYDNEACEGDPVSTNTSYDKSISASVDEDVVNALYAKFVPYATYYANVSVAASEGGSVYLSLDATTPSESDYTANMELPTSATVASAPPFTYHVYAQPKYGYDFVGWMENGSLISVNNGVVTVNATSIDEANPTTRNLTAVFKEWPIWTWTGEQVEAAKNFYLYNTDAEKFLAGNSTPLLDIEDSNITTWIPTSQGDNKFTFASSNGYRISFQNLAVTGYYRVNEKSGAETLNVNNVAGNNEYKYTLSCKPAISTWYVASENGNFTSQQNNVNNRCYWLFISESQKDKYLAYMEAYNAALALAEGEDAAAREELDAAMLPYKYARMADADTKTEGLKNLTKVILNIKDKCYGTFVSQFDVTLPDGVVAFGVYGKSDKEVTLSEISLSDQALASGNAVIVRMNDKSAMRKVYFGPKPETDQVESNGLLGFYEDGVEITQGSYILQDQGKGQMFYVVGDKPFKSSKNRCCLPASTTGGAKVLSISFAEGEETTVGAVSANATVVGYYSVNGAKLSAPKVGVNLVKMSDGTVKKVLVK